MPVRMKAIRFHEFGGPEVLRYEDAPKPELKPGEGAGARLCRRRESTRLVSA